MNLNSFKSIKIATLTTFLLVGVSVVSAKSSIQNLTSKENTKEVPAPPSTSPASSSNGTQEHSIGFGLGQTFLYRDFSKNGEDKISAELLYNYSANHSFDLLINYHYSSHSLGNTETIIQGLVSSVKAKLFQFDNLSPFVLAGLGFYSPKVKRLVHNTLKESETKIVFGWNMGIGFDLKLNRHFMTGMLLQYHNPFDVQQGLDPEVEGSYFKLLLTSYYTF